MAIQTETVNNFSGQITKSSIDNDTLLDYGNKAFNNVNKFTMKWHSKLEISRCMAQELINDVANLNNSLLSDTFNQINCSLDREHMNSISQVA